MAKTSFRVLIFLWIAGAAALFGADIEGRVRAGGGGADLIKRATIQLLREHVVVDEHFIGSDGRFEFRNLVRGSYQVRVRAEGYVEEETTVDLLRPTSREMLRVDLRPVPKTPEGRAATISVAEYSIPREAKREYQRGLEDRKRGQCAKALPHLQKAIAIFEKYGDAFNELGNCLKEMGDLHKAEDSFKKAVEYAGSVYPSMNLADLYASQSRFAEADGVLRQSMAQHPTEGDLYFAMAQVQLHQGRPKDAEEAALRAHEKMHRMADVHLFLAKLYLSLERYPALIAQLQLYLNESPKGPLADRVRRNLKELNLKNTQD